MIILTCFILREYICYQFLIVGMHGNETGNTINQAIRKKIGIIVKFEI